MEKKSIIISAAVSLVLIVSIAFILGSNSDSEKVSETKAIPLNTALFFEIHDLRNLTKKLNNGNLIYSSIEKVKAFKSLISKLDLSHKLYQSELVDLIHNIEKCWISITTSSKSSFTTLYTFPNIANEDVLDEIENLISNNNTLEKYKYEKAIINSFRIKKQKFYFCLHKEFLLFSESNLNIEASIRQINSEYDIKDDAQLRSLLKTSSSKSDINAYINHAEFSKLLSIFTHRRYKRKLKNRNPVSQWSEFDIEIDEDVISLNGLSTYSADKKNYFNTHHKIDPQEITLSEVMPSTTAYFEVITWDSFKEYLNKYKKNLNNTGGISRFNKKLYLHKNKANIELDKLFLNIIDNQAANLFCYRSSRPLRASNFNVLKLKSQHIAHSNIRSLIEKFCRDNKLTTKDYIQFYKFDSETSYPIYKLPFKGSANLFFGDFFGLNGQNYCSFYKNYLILGETAKDLSYFLEMNILKSTLSNDSEFESIQRFYSSSSNLHIYLNIKKSLNLIRTFLDRKILNIYEQNTSHLNKLQAINYQATTESDMMFQSITINFNSKFSNNETKTAIWESSIPHRLRSKPKFVKNHKTGEKEIFIQDEQNNVYLVSKSGRVLWSRKVDGEILGGIHQVDLYRNNKLQIAFNTKNSFYAIDRLGNYVTGFPVSIPGKASNPISVFDYDKSRDYRFVLASQNKRILMFNRKGKLVDGWKFGKTESIVSKPIKHFRIKDRDYIVCTDQNRVYILNRIGKTRVKVMQTISRAEGSRLNLVKAKTIEQSRIVFSDVYGKIISVYFNGAVKRKELAELYSRNHLFEYVNLDQDKAKEYVIADDNILEVYKKGKRLFQKEFNSDILSVNVYRFSSKINRIGVHTENQKAYLFDIDGATENSFPIKSTTPFSIGRFDKKSEQFSIVLGTPDKKLNHYEYNPSE